METEYAFMDDLDEALERNGFSSRRKFYLVQKDFSGSLVIVLPVDFLAKSKGDKVRVEFYHDDSEQGRSISLT